LSQSTQTGFEVDAVLLVIVVTFAKSFLAREKGQRGATVQYSILVGRLIRSVPTVATTSSSFPVASCNEKEGNEIGSESH
jgi:hypothetical protein